ncbi:MAG: hypothetical protein JWM42_3628 [Burkholderia sp.]|nr:hypothetical protein [Burkholderia sp.]
MSRMWIPVSAVQARAHPLYGRGGWLTLFVLSVLMGLVVSGAFWTVILTVRTAADSVIRFLGVYSAVSAFAGLVMLALFVMRSPNFRVVAISLLLVPWPILAAIYFDSVPHNLILGGSAIWFVSVLIWASYLQRSRRVRVTFEHCVEGEAPDANGRSEPVYVPRDTMVAAGGRDPAAVMSQKFDVINCDDPSADPAEDCWAQALVEYETDRKKPGLWARAFAEAHGNETAAKALYLKLRATQLFDDYQEQAREVIKQQQAEQEAVALNQRYENSLTEHQLKIKRAMELAEYGGEDAFAAAVDLIRLLGGTIERKSSVVFSSSGWKVELAGYSDRFGGDEELMQWVRGVVLPKARLLLPVHKSY